MMDWVEYAEQEVAQTYAVRVSAAAKRKSLLKFGRNSSLGTSLETIWEQGGSETYPTDNLINSISSSSAADEVTLTIEGHTILNGEYSFVIQTVTLAGQTTAALDIPVARVSRGYNAGGSDLAGDVYIYETDTVTGGVPQTAEKIHAKILAGTNQTFKAATTFSAVDFAFITQVYGSVQKKTSAVADFRFEVRSPGGVFRPRISFSSATNSGLSVINLRPYLIVPRNADVRLRSSSSTSNTGVDAGFSAVLAAIV